MSGPSHADEMVPGLGIRYKKLSTKNISRATSPAQVIPVCLAHNLREGNEAHRHRSPIDPARKGLNEVLRGSGSLDVATAVVASVFNELGIAPARLDAIMAMEWTFQPPEGMDVPAFWSECLAWVEGRYEHVASAVVHRDQKRPHMHVIVLAVADGRLAGNALTAGANRIQRQIVEFYGHMRATLGLRKAPKVKTLAELAVSAGRGAKTRAEAAKSDAALITRAKAKNDPAKGGRGSDGRGSDCFDELHQGQPPATPKTPTPLIAQIPSTAQDWQNLFEDGAWEVGFSAAQTESTGVAFLERIGCQKAGLPLACSGPSKAPQPTPPPTLPEPPDEAPELEHGNPGEHEPELPEQTLPADRTEPCQFERVRDCEQAADHWDSDRGEFIPAPTKPAQQLKAEVRAQVESALQGIGKRRMTKAEADEWAIDAMLTGAID